MRYVAVLALALGLFACGDNGYGNGGGSGGTTNNQTNETVVPGAPQAPAGIQASEGDGQVTLAWAPVTDASSYRILLSSAAAGPFVQVANVTATTYTQVNLQNRVVYYFRIRSVGDAGTGPDSVTVVVNLDGNDGGDGDANGNGGNGNNGRGPDNGRGRGPR